MVKKGNWDPLKHQEKIELLKDHNDDELVESFLPPGISEDGFRKRLVAERDFWRPLNILSLDYSEVKWLPSLVRNERNRRANRIAHGIIAKLGTPSRSPQLGNNSACGSRNKKITLKIGAKKRYIS